MELFTGKLNLTTKGWKNALTISLRAAAKLSNPQNEFHGGICTCKTGCKSMRCTCKRKGAICSNRCHIGTSCSNQTSPCRKLLSKTPVSTLAAEESGCWLPQLFLGKNEKQTLERGEWLTDQHVTAAQMLLTKQFLNINGLQTPLLSQTNGWALLKPTGIQILNDNQKHWICISIFHPDIVNVYDSLYGRVSKNIQNQVCALLRTQLNSITLQMMQAQVQTRGSDCGLFAIATATALCHEIPPSNTMWDQCRMRAHLIKCFENGKMLPFPGRNIAKSCSKDPVL